MTPPFAWRRRTLATSGIRLGAEAPSFPGIKGLAGFFEVGFGRTVRPARPAGGRGAQRVRPVPGLCSAGEVLYGLAGLAWAGQGGSEPGEQDVEAAFEFGGAVIRGQDGGQAAQQREFADWQPVQAQPQQVVGLVRVFDEFLQFVEDVAVQEAEQGPVDVQRVGSAVPGPGGMRCPPVIIDLGSAGRGLT